LVNELKNKATALKGEGGDALCRLWGSGRNHRLGCHGGEGEGETSEGERRAEVDVCVWWRVREREEL
jgi:hypothetical protein